MAISHVKSNTIADFTGTVTVFNSVGATQTANATDLVRPSDWNSVHNQYYTLSGNTNNASTVSGTNVVFQGAGAVTLTGTNQTIVFNAPVQSVQTQSNIQALSAGTQSVGTGMVVFADSNGVGFGLNGQTLTASYTRPVVSNAIQAVGSATGSGTNTSRFAADDHVHEGVFSVGVSTGGNTAGDTRVGPGRYVLQGGNNITLSQITGANAVNTIVISGGAGGAGDGVNALVVNAGASTATTTLTLSNSNNVSFGHNAGVITATATFAQTNQSAIRAFGVSNTGQTAGNTGVSTGIDWVMAGSGSITLSQSTAGGGPNTVWVQHPAWITTARASNDAIGLNSAFTAGPLAMTINSSGLSLNASSAAGTSSGFTGANISASITHNTAGLALSMSVAAPGAAAENNNHNLLGANTSGNTTASGSTIGLSGINMTLSGTNGSVINLSVPATSSLVGVNGISISTNGSTISVSAQAVTFSYFNPQDAYLQVAGQQGQSTLHMQPAKFPNVQFDRWVIPIINTNSSNSSGSHSISFNVGIYSNNGGTLSLLVSTSSSTAVTHSGTAGSYSLYSGMRLFTIPHTTTITEGQYWIGVLSRTTSGGANGTYSQLLASQLNSSFFGHFGSSVNKSMQYTRGLGILSVQTAALPSAVNFTDLSGASNSLVLRQPIIYVVSGTN